jgi:hypothetical protein
MRLACIYLAVSAFVVLGVIDVASGNHRQGVASICLAVANGLLLL